MKEGERYVNETLVLVRATKIQHKLVYLTDFADHFEY